ncbi:hypothetical protein As57867_007078, partial [Aphanomyces stellatus]
MDHYNNAGREATRTLSHPSLESRSKFCRAHAARGPIVLGLAAFEPYGYRILFVHCLDTCLADARAKATAARVCSPADLLAKLLDQLSFSIPQEHWTTLLFLLALEMRSKTLGSNTILKDSPPSETMSPPQDSFRTLQRRVFFSPATLDCVTPAAVQALTSCSPDEIFLAHDACTQDVSLGKQRRRPSHANVSILQDAAVAALLRSVPVAHLCLLLMLECPRPAYDSFCTALYVHTLAKQSAARGRGGNKEWFKALQSTSDDWYWCIASPCVFTSMDLLHLMLETTVPRETWPDVLKLLLQRTDVQALTFQVPQDVETSVVGLFDSIATMNQFEGQHPGSFEALKWIVLDMDAPEKWDALLQFNKKFRLDYRPVGLISHQKVNMGKPKHQQRHHAADDDMPSTRFVHVVASLPSSSSSSSSTRGIGDPTHAVHTLAHLPQTVQPNRLMLHPSSSHAFGHAFRRTLLRLVSIPFSTTIGDFLQLVPLEPTSKNVISIVVWRLLCGLTFFHAALL